MGIISAFHRVEIRLIRKAGRTLARRGARLLLAFQEGQLRFEGHSGVRAQIYWRSHMVGENKNRGTALAVQNSPVQARGIFHRAHSNGMRRKHPQEEYESKRSRAILANCKSEKRAPAALRGAWHRLCGNSHLLRPMRALPDNSDRRKKTHSPASKREPRASLDSELVASSLRIEFASLLASYYYATLATRSRQLDRPGVQKSQCFSHRSRASLCLRQPFPQKSGRQT
jgi:hypothetical protein